MGEIKSDEQLTVGTLFPFDEVQMANLSVGDKWWEDAYNWFLQVKALPVSSLEEVHRYWLVQMKQKLLELNKS